jgi:hypothetical protein
VGWGSGVVGEKWGSIGGVVGGTGGGWGSGGSDGHNGHHDGPRRTTDTTDTTDTTTDHDGPQAQRPLGLGLGGYSGSRRTGRSIDRSIDHN